MRSRALILFTVLISVILTRPVDASAGQDANGSVESRSLDATVEEPLARQGLRAVEEGRYEQAETLFKALARDDPNGHYYLARLYLMDGFLDPPAANTHLNEARGADPDNPDYLRERLRQLRSDLSYFTSGSDRVGDRNRIGRRLLEILPDDATALEEVAATAASDYFWLQRRFGADAGKRLRRRIDRNLDDALHHFERAIEVHPTRAETYREYLKVLIRTGQLDRAVDVAATMTTHLSDSAEAWLLSGLALHLDGDPERAWPRFTRGLSVMDADERETFDAWDLLVRRDLRDSLVAAGEDAEAAFWRLRDTRRMTVVNERLVSHYGRLVYSDLFYPKWREFVDDDWLITPGDVIVRYGYPLGDHRLPRADPAAPGGPKPVAELMLSFANGSFLFEDWNGTGEYVIPTLPDADDPTTLARSAFQETPERADPPGKEIFEAPYIATTFPDPDGPTELVVAFGVPVWTDDATIDLPIETRAGVFIVDDEGYDVDRFVRTSPRMRAEDLVLADTLLLWTNWATLRADPGSYRLQLEVESENMIASHWVSVEVPGLRDGDLWLSDIMPATLVEPVEAATGTAGITRGDLHISPAVMNVFSRDVPLYLYFELGGLDTSSGAARYETQIFIADEDDGGVLSAIGRVFTGDGVRVAASFESSIESTSDRQYFILDLRDEDPGPHLIGLQITDLTTGASVESSRRIDIR